MNKSATPDEDGAEDWKLAYDPKAREEIDRLGMSADEVNACYIAFQEADVDGSGTVDFRELCALLERLAGTQLSVDDIDTLNRRFKLSAGLLAFHDFLGAYCSTSVYEHRNLKKMITCIGSQSRKQLRESLLDPHSRVRFSGVPLQAVQGYLREQVAEKEACLNLPWVLLLFISFLCSVSWHQRTHVLQGQRHAIIQDLEENANFAYGEPVPWENPRTGFKNLYNVVAFADFWSWMNLGFVPLYWAEGWDSSEAMANTLARCTSHAQKLQSYIGLDLQGIPSAAEFSKCPEQATDLSFLEAWKGNLSSQKYLWFNSVVGGVRLKQSRAVVIDCPGDKAYASHLHSGLCIEPVDRAWSKPESWSSWHMEDVAGGETVFISSGIPQAGVRQQLRDLEKAAWLNPLTTRVEMLFITYNPHIDLLVVVRVGLDISSSGHFHRSIDPVPLWLDIFHNSWYCYLADIVWLLCSTRILLLEVHELGRNLCHKGMRQGMKDYARLSNAIDWASTLSGLLIAIVFVIHLDELERLKGYLRQCSLGAVGSWSDLSLRAEFFDYAHSVAAADNIRRRLLAVYPFVLISRVFKVCAGQPRLGLVTRTISAAGVDVIHFGSVFIGVFALFTTSAMILFGSQDANFSSFARAADSTIHILMEDFEWDDLHETGRLPGAIWYWTFIWVMDMLLLNMLLAIVMDVYTECRGTLRHDAETIWSQAHQMYRRFRDKQLGKRLALAHVKTCVEDFIHLSKKDPKDVVTVSSLMNVVPGLKEDQSLRILTNALHHLEEDAEERKGLADVFSTLSTLSKQVTQVQTSTYSLIHMSDLQAKMTSIIGNHAEVREAKASQPLQRVDAHPAKLPESQPQGPLEEVISLLKSVEGKISKLDSRMDDMDNRMSWILQGRAREEELSRL
eukprot:TRINITY_DN64801_c0_g1_i1.p1 TRINITY_DN64801_c0_g1~~TRINITY_DN64801_c0_g1_i1.p1  ORF type:complete len:902 (+),score=111.03 TRINITY_DN64801_c0_g1_i1:115-2820(+)